MRINKYLAERLGISRRKADDFLTLHDVTINGMNAQPGQDVSDADQILVDGKPIATKKMLVYILLNKPVGYVCSHDGQGSKTVYDLLSSDYQHLQAVGRLDKDSSGLLLLTNDGALHQQLTHPSYQKIKLYQVTIDTVLKPEDKAQIEKGVILDDGISSLKLSVWQKNGKGWIVTMHEGRNRQIRRTFEALGYNVKSLHRTQFGQYNIGNLPSGTFELVTANL